MAHLYRTLAHVLAATVIAMLIGLGVTAHGLVAFALTALVVGSLTTFVISLLLNWARQMLGIMSAGRLVQIGLGLGTATLTFNAIAFLFPAALTVTSGFIASTVILAAFLILSVFTGNINNYKGRSWLPKRWPKNMPPHR